jgi:hypothetical protein
MIDPEHKDRIDAMVTKLFAMGVTVVVPQTEEAYASLSIEDGKLVIRSKVLFEEDVVFDPRNN